MRLNMLLIFGGQSSEHDISTMSAKNVLSYIDSGKYEILIAGITKDGRWLYLDDICDDWEKGGTPCLLSPDATEKSLYIFKGDETEKKKIDVAFPVLHGLYGEDGTIQGLLELAQIPYVGSSVLASAVSMDKVYTKQVVDHLNIRQADSVFITREDVKKNPEEAILRVEKKLPYPVFVKPSCAGSSVGVGKAKNREELRNAIITAEKFDSHILVEEMIYGREIECAVFGTTEDAKAFGIGEIITGENEEFYDFDAKYNNNRSVTDTNPKLPEEVKREIMESAEKIFKALSAFSLSRVDFFYSDQGEVIFNEINTMPGFTGISMYPMIMSAAGISKEELVENLIQTAFKRNEH